MRPDREKFENRQLKVKFDYPAGWKEADLTHNSVKIVSKKYPEKDIYEEFVEIISFTTDWPIDDIVGKLVIPEYSQKEGYEPGPIQPDTAAGVGVSDARRVEFSWRDRDSGKIKAIVLVIKAGTQGAYIHYFAQEHAFDDYKYGYEMIMSSFSFM